MHLLRITHALAFTPKKEDEEAKTHLRGPQLSPKKAESFSLFCPFFFFSFTSFLFLLYSVFTLQVVEEADEKKKSKRNQCARIRSFRFFSLSVSATESLAFVTRPLPLIDFHAISTLDLMARLSVMNDESRPVFPTHNSVLNYVIRMGRVEGT